MIRDAQQEFIGTLEAVIHDETCTVTLRVPYVARSYFNLSPRGKPGGKQMQFYLH